ncbi:uncharacterized protein LOC106348935 [Brassica napus]|uniref:Uncharacterized protein n=1 Tax=Brassica oleracea var. oleracea TaxID=109376 RepID=A0A0D3DFU8_BRAOL|nr:PREDICTED: uncharacterized protein LOC106305556 [Brassica oleracea var. oleracea]XP_013644229.2 uncharacterized protein LOC106348935 [Brassica napus]
MNGYYKMDSTDQNPDPVDLLQTQKPDQELAEMKPRLSRNRSVAASGQVLRSPMKTAMSMRRSSSVSERYCRIYDQSSVTFPLPFNEEDEENDKEGIHKKKSNKIKKKALVKACKRFFGIS